MANPTFTESDLGVGQQWLDQMNTALASRGLADSVQSCITDATQIIADYSVRFVLADARWLRLMRPLAIYTVHARLGTVPEAIKAAYEAALKELTEIRDGKFPDLLPADPLPEDTVQTGSWGSETRIGIRIA